MPKKDNIGGQLDSVSTGSSGTPKGEILIHIIVQIWPHFASLLPYYAHSGLVIWPKWVIGKRNGGAVVMVRKVLQIQLSVFLILWGWILWGWQQAEASDRIFEKADQLYAWVGQVTLRESAETDSRTMGYLREGQVVKFLSRSNQQRMVTLRGIAFNEDYYEVQYSGNKVAWVYGGALKPFLKKSDEGTRAQVAACIQQSNSIDQMWRSQKGYDDAARLSNQKIAAFLQQTDHTEGLIYQRVSPPEQCAGTYPVLKCYDNGMFERGFFETPDALVGAGYHRLRVFTEDFPAFLGVLKTDSQRAIKAHLGKAYRVSEHYVMYRSEAPEAAESKVHFDEKYQIFIFFDHANIKFLVILENQDVC